MGGTTISTVLAVLATRERDRAELELSLGRVREQVHLARGVLSEAEFLRIYGPELDTSSFRHIDQNNDGSYDGGDGYFTHFHKHTRSLGGVVIPKNVSQVQIQARCNVDGWNEDTTLVELN